MRSLFNLHKGLLFFGAIALISGTILPPKTIEHPPIKPTHSLGYPLLLKKDKVAREEGDKGHKKAYLQLGKTRSFSQHM